MTRPGRRPRPADRQRWTLSTRVVAIALAFAVASAVAWAYWAAGSSSGSNGAAAAATMQPGATPTTNVVAQAVTVSWAASTLSTGQAVDGYLVKRYDSATLVVQTILSNCTGTITATTCTENSVPNGTWKYSVTPVFATNWRGVESAKSSDAVVSAGADSTPPTNAISLSSITGGAYKNGDTVYYRGAAAGSFTLTNAVTDAGSGPASSATAALGGTPTGWTHTLSTVSTPSGGPYVSNVFQWVLGTTSSPSEAVTGRDVTGNSAIQNLSFVNDSTAPGAATITHDNGYTPGRFVTVTFAAGTDSGSGVATGRLQRAEAVLNTNGTCGTLGSFANIGPLNPTSPYSGGTFNAGKCYRFQYVVTDRVGNQQVTTSTDTAKLDYAQAVNATTGLLSQWRLGETTTSIDSMTGTAGSALTAHTADTGDTWTHLAGSAAAVIANNRVRKGGSTYTWEYTSAIPPSADYAVAADLYKVASFTGDYVGVTARLDTATSSFYSGEYWQSAANAHSYSISKFTNGVWTKYVASTTTTGPANGSTTRLRLEVSGAATTTLKLYINGTLLLSGTDTTSPFTAVGRVGIMDGDPAAATASKTDSKGMHLDNFRVTPRAADSKGSNPGDYRNTPTLGAAGALVGDTNTATTFDGVDDYVQVTGSTGIPVGASVRSVEMWFKTTSTARQTLFDYGSLGIAQQFGVWLNPAAAELTAWGYGTGNDMTFTLSASVTNGAWHHIVNTYDGTSLTFYIDGVALPSQVSTRNTVMNAYGFGIGSVITPGDPNSGGYFTGSIDEVSFYTTALDQTTVTNHYQLGTAPVPDVTGPTGGSVDATGLVGTGSRYATSTSLTIALAKGSDPSDVAATGAELRRATSTLTSAGTADGGCGSFVTYNLVATDPVTPYVDTVTDQACYSYRYIVADDLGNPTTYTSAPIKVDLTAPPAAPTFTFAGFSNTYWSGSGTTVYYRSTAGTGAFTSTATGSDTASGISAYTYPALGTNWTSTPGAAGVNTYSWSGSPAAPGSVGVTSTNNAALTSSAGTFTLTSDTTAPTVGTVSYASASQTTRGVSVSFTTGTDSGSGIGTRLLQRAAAPLTGTVCGTYLGFATVTGGTNPTSAFADTVPTGSFCYQYQYVVSDNVGNEHIAGSSDVVKVTAVISYSETVQATSGLIDYYRLGEIPASLGSSDSFQIGSAGALLTSRAGEVGSTWAYQIGSANTEQISVDKRARRNGTGYAVTYTTATPASADYSVEADLYVKSVLANDRVGVIGRLDTGAGTYYAARWEPEDTSWNLMKFTGGSGAYLEYVSGQPALAVGLTYRLKLTMTGDQLQLYVNGVLKVSATDATLTNPGKAGLIDGTINGTASKSDTAGIHFDDFQVTPSTYPRAVDSKGTNTGDYKNGVTLGVAGAMATDVDTAAQFDGVNDYVATQRPISGDFTIEFWFKSTQGIGTGTQWWNGAGLVDSDVVGTVNDFGVSLRSDGKVVAGVGGGSGDTSIVSSSTGHNDGLWHHVAFTRTQSTGVFTLYVDGVSRGTATNNTSLLTAQPLLIFGRLASGGNHFAGFLDEIAIYDVALPGATVTAHHAAR